MNSGSCFSKRMRRGKGIVPLLAFSARRQATARAIGVLALLSCSSCVAAEAGAQATPQPAVVVQPGAPGTASRVLPPSTRPSSPRISPEDIRFMQGMIMHHAQAVAMTAMIPSHTDNQQVRLLGERISASQADEMQFMKRWLAQRGEPISMAMPGMPDMDMSGNAMPAMPGMLTPAQMAVLKAAKGPGFDRLFLAGMIQHHNGALVMVKDLFDTEGAGQDADLFNFATDADNTQRAEISIMQGLLAQDQPTEQGSH